MNTTPTLAPYVQDHSKMFTDSISSIDGHATYTSDEICPRIDEFIIIPLVFGGFMSVHIKADGLDLIVKDMDKPTWFPITSQTHITNIDIESLSGHQFMLLVKCTN